MLDRAQPPDVGDGPRRRSAIMASMDIDELFDAWERAWSGRSTRAFESVCAVDVHYEDPLTPEPLVK